MKYVVTKIINEKEEILFLLRAVKPFGWCFPGGKIDPEDKSLIDAAWREVKEETGIDLDKEQMKFWRDGLTYKGEKVRVYEIVLDHTPIVKTNLRESLSYRWIKGIPEDLIFAGNTHTFI